MATKVLGSDGILPRLPVCIEEDRRGNQVEENSMCKGPVADSFGTRGRRISGRVAERLVGLCRAL